MNTTPKSKQRKLRRPKTSIPPSGKSKVLGSQDRSARPTLRVLAYVSERSTVAELMEFHMTIQAKVSNLSPRQLSILLSICVLRALEGVDLTLYLSLEYLWNRLVKSGTEELALKDEKQRHTVLLADLVLSSIRGTWLNLSDPEKLPDEVIRQIVDTNWLPTERTIQSWKEHWDLEKYLKVRIVPVESLIERQPSTAERYSGYIRGYGQDGNPPAPHKTKDDPLDGDISTGLPIIPLQDWETYIDILNSIEIMRAKKRNR